MKKSSNNITNSNSFNDKILNKEGTVKVPAKYMAIISEELQFKRIYEIIPKYNKMFHAMKSALAEHKKNGTTEEFDFVKFNHVINCRSAAYAMEAQEKQCDSTADAMKKAYKEYMTENAVMFKDTYTLEELLEMGLLSKSDIAKAKAERVQAFEWSQMQSLVGNSNRADHCVAVEEAIIAARDNSIVDLEITDTLQYIREHRSDVDSIGDYYTGKRSMPLLNAEEQNSMSYSNDTVAIEASGATENFIRNYQAEIMYGRTGEVGSDTYFELGFDASTVRDGETGFMGSESEQASFNAQEYGIIKKLVRDLEENEATFKEERELSEQLVAIFPEFARAFLEQSNLTKMEDIYAKCFFDKNGNAMDFAEHYYTQGLLTLTEGARTRVGRGLIVFVPANNVSEYQLNAHKDRMAVRPADKAVTKWLDGKVGMYFDQYQLKRIRSALYKAASVVFERKATMERLAAFDKVCDWFDTVGCKLTMDQAAEAIVSDLGMETLVLAVKHSWKVTKFSTLEYKVLQQCGAVNEAKGVSQVKEADTSKVAPEIKEIISQLNDGAAVLSVVNRSNAKEVIDAARAGVRINDVSVYRAVLKMA